MVVFDPSCSSKTPIGRRHAAYRQSRSSSRTIKLPADTPADPIYELYRILCSEEVQLTLMLARDSIQLHSLNSLSHEATLRRNRKCRD
jgi:hypothetical protein